MPEFTKKAMPCRAISAEDLISNYLDGTLQDKEFWAWNCVEDQTLRIEGGLVLSDFYPASGNDMLVQHADSIEVVSAEHFYIDYEQTEDSVKPAISSASDNAGPVRSHALKKNGMYYAHNDCGYVSRVLLAEIYTEEYATRYARMHDEITAVPVAEVLTGVEEIQEYIDRLELMKKAVENSPPAYRE